MADQITIQVSDVNQVWAVLNNLIPITEQPFSGNARRLLFKLQTEKKYLEGASPEDIQAVADKEITLGEKIPPPDVYLEEQRPILEKLCKELPEQKSQIAELVDEQKNGKKEKVEQ